MIERTTTRFTNLRRRAAHLVLPVVATTTAITVAALTAGTANAAASTQTLTFGAAEDAYSWSHRPNFTTGTSGKLVTGRLGADTAVSYLRFVVPALPAGTVVDSATVTLTTDGRRLPSLVRLARVSAAWSEKTLTASNDPAVGATVATVTPKTGATTVAFNVKGVISKAGSYSLAVTTPVTNDVIRFRSSEYATGRPALKLVVRRAVTPSPSVPPTTRPPTTPPVTLPPVIKPPTTPPITKPPTPAECVVDKLLIPSCNLLWGAAAGGFSTTPRDQALKEWEAKTGRTATVYHTYHRGDELFPTKAEMAMANDPANPRLLFLNWKVNYGTKWSTVPRGQQDARIDRLATYIKANYRDKFFMTMHHEPENDVDSTPGSGMTAKDYAAMFRHTVLRLRAKGVTNAVFVVAYMGIETYFNQSWWHDLYPGDDVVDWIGLDAYLASKPGGYHFGTFTDLVNRTTNRALFPGFYNWSQTRHADKPLMLVEWGVHEYTADPTQKARILSTVLAELTKYPAIKGLLWFDCAKDQNGADIRIDSSPLALAEMKKIAADPRFNVRIR